MTDLEHDPELARRVDELVAEYHLPGVAVGVVHGGRSFGVTRGVTSTKDPLPIDPDTLFMIGSTTKTITGTALMRLSEQGLLTLEDRVVDHLPEFALSDPEAARQVTLEQLLNHTGGWRGDTHPVHSFADDALAATVATIARELQEFGPGEHTSYNNGALMVAGRVIEVVTGLPFEKAVTDLVLTPLGMTNTYFFPWDVALRRTAVGHVFADGAPLPAPSWPFARGLHPAGGALSSLRDQQAYARFHLDGTTSGSAPIGENTRLLMQQQTATMSSTLDGVGLTWLLSHHGDVRIVAHGGNISMLQTSSFSMAPDHGLAVTVMTNCRYGASVGAAVLSWAVQHYLGRPARPPLPPTLLTQEQLAEYEGTYDSGAWQRSVIARDGRLFAEFVIPQDAPPETRAAFAAPPTELVFVGPDQVAPAADPVETVGDFIRDPDGSIRWFRIGMRMSRRI